MEVVIKEFEGEGVKGKVMRVEKEGQPMKKVVCVLLSTLDKEVYDAHIDARLVAQTIKANLKFNGVKSFSKKQEALVVGMYAQNLWKSAGSEIASDKITGMVSVKPQILRSVWPAFINPDVLNYKYPKGVSFVAEYYMN